VITILRYNNNNNNNNNNSNCFHVKSNFIFNFNCIICFYLCISLLKYLKKYILSSVLLKIKKICFHFIIVIIVIVIKCNYN
jgi:hypothetical protein